MKLVKLLLVLITTIGLISMSGCIGSNDNNVNPNTNTNKEYVNHGTEEVVYSKPHPKIDENYKSWIKGNPSAVKPIVADEIVYSKIYGSDASITLPVFIPDDPRYFTYVALEHNITDAYNKTKYKKQYEQYLKIVDEIKQWEAENLYGKTVVEVWYKDPYYIEILYDGGKRLDYDLVRRGYAVFTKKHYTTFRKIHEKRNLTKMVEMDDELLMLQEEAKKNKRGVWSIDFSQN